MTWTKLSDDFTERDELLAVDRSHRLLLIEMYVWANRLERNGVVPLARLHRLTDIDDPIAAANALSDAGLVDIVDEHVLLDWSEQELAEDVQKRRKHRADIQKAYRQRRDAHNRGDHSLCDPRHCPQAVTGNAASNKTGHETPPRPAPSRPLTGAGTGTPDDSAQATPTGCLDCGLRNGRHATNCELLEPTDG